MRDGNNGVAYEDDDQVVGFSLPMRDGNIFCNHIWFVS